MRMTPYLYFKGQCESALRFYEACGLGQIRAGSPCRSRHSSGAPNTGTLPTKFGVQWAVSSPHHR